MEDKTKMNNLETIDKFAKIHFKHCGYCIPGALDLPIEKRLCGEAQELARIRNKSEADDRNTVISFE